MVHFSKFRLSGFKSFVDLTEVEIGQGLNGVVGPNGCGKSNLLEALRWVMGETSAKKMRGDGMEDVIFAGTAQRPPRSAAEVSLFLDNSENDAPHPFEKVQDIQITRRIERDKGSLYKVNGKTVRARDVQMLFADTVSGANSPALVSQGKITQIINAKPHERRHVLEESAGVAGLYTRRHEAELRLRAAESNLARLDDSMQTSRTQLSSLRRQAGAARKYTELSDRIRKLELVLLWLEWNTSLNSFKEKNTAYESLETTIAKAMGEVSKQHNAHEKIVEGLPALRQNDMKLQAQLQALKIEQNRLAQDQKELQETLERTQHEKELLEKDLADTHEQMAETKTSLSDLDTEEADAKTRHENAPQRLEEQQKTLASLQAQLDKLEKKYQDLLNKQAEAQAQAKEALTQYGTLKDKKERSENRIKDMEQSLNTIKQEKAELGALDDLHNKFKAAQEQLDAQKLKTETSEETKEIARRAVEECQKALQDLQTDERIISGEIATLQKLIASMGENQKGDVLEHLSVTNGYEKALARAIGDLGLNATLNNDGDVYWETPLNTQLNADNKNIDLPRLNSFAKAPEALSAAIQSVYVCEEESQASEFAKYLSQGESLVTKNGYYYRWDGLRIKPSANTESAGLSLEHKNRLELLEAQKDELSSSLEKAASTLEVAEKTYMAKYEALRQDSQQLQSQEQLVKDLYKNYQRLDNEIKQIDIRLEHAEERFNAAKTEFDDISTQYLTAKDKISSLDEDKITAINATLDDLKEQISAQRDVLNTQRSDYDVLSFQIKQDDQRLHRIMQDRATLTQRLQKNEAKQEELTNRIKETSQRIVKIENNPNKDSNRHHNLHEKISELETQCAKSSDDLATQETLRADSSAALRQAEQELSSFKEKRAVLQAEISAVKSDLERIKGQIASQHNMSPAVLKQKLDDVFENEHPSEKDAQADLIRLKHERESMGPVNLRAEVEADELQESLTELEREYEDLTAAIDHLRTGIAKLNKEARERMRAAFIQVNAHFQKLFTRLFNGGQAHLEMIESDDPLEAGLEIFAQPPGKALQSLSLLSGGEQTMASIALIFAMFMTNPSPICVLDEIDAPLDDSNVDRMCDLLEHIAAQGKTRFMVITHHRMTMARMDRLYGVTMSEKGVSKLVSVDLATQASFIDQLTA